MTRQMLAGQFRAVVDIANNSKKYGEEKSTNASITLPKVENLIGEFTAAIMMFEKSLDTSSSDDATTASDQVQGAASGQDQGAAGGLLTGTASRANIVGVKN